MVGGMGLQFVSECQAGEPAANDDGIELCCHCRVEAEVNFPVKVLLFFTRNP
jgi:hypothetical protein